MKKCVTKCMVAIGALAVALGSAQVDAQGYPQRTVKVVVPFVAGGNTDNQARIVSERLSAVFGHQFIVENRVGAGGGIAAEYVAKAAPDGYTLFFAASPLFSLPLVQKVNFDPFKDFAPISMIGTNAFVLGVHVSVPVTTIKEFVDYVKQRPGQLNYSSGGTGTTSHLAPALFLARAGLKMTHIPYKGGAQAVTSLVAGEVQMQMGNASEQIQYSKTGKIRMLGVTAEKRIHQLPDVPAIAETYPGFRAITWNGYLAPAATPKALVDQLAKVIIKVVHEPAVVTRLDNIGVDALGNTPEEFADYVRKDDVIWRDAVKAAGVKIE